MMYPGVPAFSTMNSFLRMFKSLLKSIKKTQMIIIRLKVNFLHSRRHLKVTNGAMPIWQLKHKFRKIYNLEASTIQSQSKKVKIQKLMEVLRERQKTASTSLFSWTF